MTIRSEIGNWVYLARFCGMKMQALAALRAIFKRPPVSIDLGPEAPFTNPPTETYQDPI